MAARPIKDGDTQKSVIPSKDLIGFGFETFEQEDYVI